VLEPDIESVGVENDLCLPYTWWLLDEPGMDDRLKEAGDSLDEMFERFGIRPVRIDEAGKEMLFLARFEGIHYKGNLEHSDAIAGEDVPEDVIMFIDFLGGMFYETVEMAGIVGELSSNKENISVITEAGAVAPSMPVELFEGYEDDKSVYNGVWLDTMGGVDPFTEKTVEPAEAMVDDLEGMPVPEKLHWWHRLYITDANDTLCWPVPGEFLSLCPRLFPTLPWGDQETNPFMFSGNWIETVHYTTAKIIEVIEPDEEFFYQRYKVQYRKYDELVVKPTDFAEYKEDDIVTILRVPEDKESWTWEDLTEFDTENWVIAPISFYCDIANKEE